MDKVREKIADNLRALILRDYRTIEVFAHENGFNKGWVYKILNRKIVPKLDSAILLSEALGCTLNDIYPGRRK